MTIQKHVSDLSYTRSCEISWAVAIILDPSKSHSVTIAASDDVVVSLIENGIEISHIRTTEPILLNALLKEINKRKS